MATLRDSIPVSSPESGSKRVAGYPADSRRFDWLNVLAMVWFLAGLFLDGWAHNNIPSLETFFTPWHAVLYSGFLAVAAVVGITQWRNVSRGYAWTQALPRGYWLSLVGIAVFAVGGVGDMIWHTLFGIEQGSQALFSPTHLLLATGGILFVTGPVRAIWARPNSHGWRDLAPALVALTILLSLFTFFMQYSNLFINPAVLVGYPPTQDSYFIQVTSFMLVFIPAALMMGVLLFAVRRWQLPFGAVALMFTLNALLMSLIRFSSSSPYALDIVAAFLGGLFADVLIARLRPSVENVGALRLFAFIVPFVFFLLVFAALVLSHGRGMWWEIHTWLGVPFLAGAMGVGLTFLLAPPQIPENATR